MSVSHDHDSRMLTALVRLHDALQAARLPLDLDGAAALRESRARLIEQLEDYVLPRQMSVEAPLLAVVGGSTGAGKSTLVNSLVGHRVTASGLLRPTTRSAVLVHHPADAAWFGPDRLLPELARVDRATDDAGSLQLVATDAVPAGLAILDAPDVDSVEADNRRLAGQLLAAADLWLFVTSAARYADQVPWDHLKQAAERSAAVAVVLDRTPPDAVATVAAHLARMLASRGLKDSPLFTVPEAEVSEDGLLPAAAVADVLGWLRSLADDPGARSVVVRQTLDGAVRSLAARSHAIADGVATQQEALGRLREAVATAYERAESAATESVADGSLVRGEVAARWRELAETGELLRTLEGKGGWLRDRLLSAVKGTSQQVDRVGQAVEAAVELMVVDHAESAATATLAAWTELGTAGALLAGHGDDLARPSTDLRRRAEVEVRSWQHDLDELVRAQGGDRRSARSLAYGTRGLAVTLAIVVLSDSAAAEPAGVGLGRHLLEAVFGADAARSLVARGRDGLERRVAALVRSERCAWDAVLGAADLPGDAALQVRQAARRVDDRRFEQTRTDPQH